jgi:hypothetical protein
VSVNHPSLGQRLERIDCPIADGSKMAEVSRQHDEHARLGDRGDRNVGKAQMKSLRRRPVGVILGVVGR